MKCDEGGRGWDEGGEEVGGRALRGMTGCRATLPYSQPSNPPAATVIHSIPTLSRGGTPIYVYILTCWARRLGRRGL